MTIDHDQRAMWHMTPADAHTAHTHIRIVNWRLIGLGRSSHETFTLLSAGARRYVPFGKPLKKDKPFQHSRRNKSRDGNEVEFVVNMFRPIGISGCRVDPFTSLAVHDAFSSPCSHPKTRVLISIELRCSFEANRNMKRESPWFVWTAQQCPGQWTRPPNRKYFEIKFNFTIIFANGMDALRPHQHVQFDDVFVLHLRNS